jgi:hypothetical protein
MKTLTLALVVLCLTCSGMAQSVPTEKEALKDAEYALKRFDEVTAQIDFNRWKAPGTLVGQMKETLNVTRKAYVKEAETILAGLDGTNPPSSAQLLAIMFDVQMAGIELTNLGDGALQNQDPDALDMAKVSDTGALAENLSRAGNTALLAAAKVFTVLNRQIEAQEDLLKMCIQSSNQAKNKPGTSK